MKPETNENKSRINDIINELRGDTKVSFDVIQGVDKALEMLDRYSPEEIKKALIVIDKVNLVEIEKLNAIQKRLTDARRDDCCGMLLNEDMDSIFDQLRDEAMR